MVTASPYPKLIFDLASVRSAHAMLDGVLTQLVDDQRALSRLAQRQPDIWPLIESDTLVDRSPILNLPQDASLYFFRLMLPAFCERIMNHRHAQDAVDALFQHRLGLICFGSGACIRRIEAMTWRLFLTRWCTRAPGIWFQLG
jgi:hypothetical protein